MPNLLDIVFTVNVSANSIESIPTQPHIIFPSIVSINSTKTGIRHQVGDPPGHGALARKMLLMKVIRHRVCC